MTRITKAAFDEFAHGGHVAALVLSSMVLTLGLFHRDPLNLPVLAIAYLIPLIIYSYNYYAEMERDRLTMPDRAAYLEKKARIYPFLISGYVALLAALIVLYDKHLFRLVAIVGVLLAAGILYTLSLKRLTRYVTGFKSYFVAGEWAIAIVLLHGMYANDAPGAFPLAIFCFILLRLLINVIFFDLKDIRSDGGEGLRTIPVVLGWKGTIRLLHLLNLLSPVPLVVGVLAGEQPGIALALVIFTMYGFRYLRHAELSEETGMTSSDYAIADFEFILWPVAAGIGVLAQDWLGPVPAAALAMLVVLWMARGLFKRRTSSSG